MSPRTGSSAVMMGVSALPSVSARSVRTGPNFCAKSVMTGASAARSGSAAWMTAPRVPASSFAIELIAPKILARAFCTSGIAVMRRSSANTDPSVPSASPPPAAAAFMMLLSVPNTSPRSFPNCFARSTPRSMESCNAPDLNASPSRFAIRSAAPSAAVVRRVNAGAAAILICVSPVMISAGIFVRWLVASLRPLNICRNCPVFANWMTAFPAFFAVSLRLLAIPTRPSRSDGITATDRFVNVCPSPANSRFCTSNFSPRHASRCAMTASTNARAFGARRAIACPTLSVAAAPDVCASARACAASLAASCASLICRAPSDAAFAAAA